MRPEYRLEAVVAQLSGQCLSAVVYYPLTAHDGLDAENWDFGDWHEPAMGVELITDAGQHYSAIWNNSFFDYSPDAFDYGLEVFAEPMTTFLPIIGEATGIGAVSVSEHPYWSPMLASPLVTAHICWASRHRTPLALQLGTRYGDVWIAAGRSYELDPTPTEPDPVWNFDLGIDDVMVIFTAAVAARAGIPEIG